MAVVKLEGVTKKFVDVTAIKDLSIECPESKIFCILGPSGAGKTTTLRMIAGLEDQTEGDIWIGDRLVNEIPAKFRNVAMVFEAYALYPHMTVFQNLAFPLRKNKNLTKNDIEKKVLETAKLLEIDMLMDRIPAFLSGGQKQRVAIGRAIVRKPNVFLFDEPIAHLDAKLREYMRTEIKRLQRSLETTTVYVTHDQIEAMTIADVVAVINFGKLHQVGTPEKIYDFPGDTFVATFVGAPAMNLFDVTLVSESNIDLLKNEYITVKVPESYLKKTREAESNDMILGIRPENIESSFKEDEKYDIESMVHTVELIGNKTIINLVTGDFLCRLKVSNDLNFKVGQKVWLNFKPEHIRIFDKKTTLVL